MGGCVLVDRNLYFYTSFPDKTLVLNVDSKIHITVDFDSNLEDVIERFNGAVVIDREIYFISSSDKVILVYNVDKNKNSLIHLNIKPKLGYLITFEVRDETIYMIFTNENEFNMFNFDTKTQKGEHLFNPVENKYKPFLLKSCLVNDRIYLSPDDNGFLGILKI